MRQTSVCVFFCDFCVACFVTFDNTLSQTFPQEFSTGVENLDGHRENSTKMYKN